MSDTWVKSTCRRAAAYAVTIVWPQKQGAKQPPVYQPASKRKGQPHTIQWPFSSKRAVAWRRLSLYTYFFLSLCKTLVEADRSYCTSTYLLANVYVTTWLGVCTLVCRHTESAACSAQFAAAAVAAAAAATARTATSSRRRTPTAAAACSAQCATTAARRRRRTVGAKTKKGRLKAKKAK